MALLLHDELAGTARRRPDAVALIAGDRRHSFAEIDRDAAALAHSLQARGLRRGDRVAVMADNSADVVVAIYAALMAGGVFVVVNPTTKADKLAFILDDCQVTALVVHRRLARVARPALAEAASVTTAVWVGGLPGEPDGGRDLAWDDALAAGRGEHPTDPGVIDADLGALIYTSGSTGRPKGVMLTHRNLVHNAWSISTYLGLREDDVIACLLPLAFDYGLFQVLMAARVGAAVLLETSFAYPRDVLDRMARHRVTVFPGVPTIWATLLPMAPFEGLDLTAVRMLTNTAAALLPAHIRRLDEAFPQARLFSMYGLTECTRVSYLDPDRLADKITSVGKAMPNTEVYVADADGRRLPPGETGELVVRGASVMRGYWGGPTPPRPASGRARSRASWCCTPATSSAPTTRASSTSWAAPTTCSSARARRSAPRRSNTSSTSSRPWPRPRSSGCPTRSTAPRSRPWSRPAPAPR